MKKYACVAGILFVSLQVVCAFTSAIDVGIGSGYVFYGEQTTKNRLDALDNTKQFVLNMSAAYRVRIAEPVWISVGLDSAFDFHWSGSEYLHAWDYAGLLGVQIYPGLAGLACGVDYALGRSIDFYRLGDGSHSSVSQWGNGFKLSVLYDFFYASEKKIRPVAGIAWRRMPRGDGADNILSVFLKLTIQ